MRLFSMYVMKNGRNAGQLRGSRVSGYRSGDLVGCFMKARTKATIPTRPTIMLNTMIHLPTSLSSGVTFQENPTVAKELTTSKTGVPG